LAGGRFVRLDEHVRDKRGALERDTQLSHFLPQTALIWSATEQVNAYVSYMRGISLGQEAPFWTSNDGAFLPSMVSRQVELGVKAAPSDSLTLGAALFRTTQPFQYAKPDGSSAGYTFVEEGQQ